jgi:hypothetical protein
MNFRKIVDYAGSVFARNSFLVFIINGLFLCAGIISARVMTLPERGFAAIFVAITGIVSYVLDLGITNAIFISTAQLKSIPKFFLTFWYYSLFSLVSSVISCSLLRFYFTEVSPSIIAAVCVFNLSSIIFRHSGARVTGSGSLEVYNWVRIVQTLAWLVSLLWILPKHPSSFSFIWCYVASWVLGAILMSICRKPRLIEDTISNLAFFKSGISSFFSNQNAIDGLKLDQVAAAKEPNMAAVAAVINSVTAQAKTVPLAIFPILSQRIHAKTPSSDRNLSKYVFLSPISVILIIPFAIYFFPKLMGTQYAGYDLSILFYLLAGATSVARLLISEKLRAIEKNVGIVYSEIIGVLVFASLYVSGFMATISRLSLAVLITQISVLIGLLFSVYLGGKGD